MATVETVTENVNLNVEESNDTTDTVPEESADNLTLGLLINVKNLVDIAIARGAYRPNELTAVGKVYDQYTAGLNKLQAQSQLKNVEDKSTPQ